MATSLNGNIFTQYVDANGAPLVGGKVYFYAAGTTTLQTIYADAGETNTLPNPITLGDRGQITTSIFLNGSYNIVVVDADGVQQFQRDNFTLNSATSETLANLQALGAVLGDYTTVYGLTTIAAGDIVIGDTYGGLYKLAAGGDPSLNPEADDYDYKGDGAEWQWLNMAAQPTGHKGYWSALNSRSTPIQSGDVVIGSTTKGLYELRSGGNSGNDPESDTYTAAGVGTDWFDVIKRNQSNTGTTGTGLPDNTLTGCKISNGTVDANHDIDIAAGQATDSTNAEIITVSAITKQLDAGWAAGTNAGGLDTGSVAADTVYAVFVIKKDSDSSSDGLFSLSGTSPTMPSGYTVFRRVAWIKTDTSANIISFIQEGDDFYYESWEETYDLTNPGTSAVTVSTTTPANVRGYFNWHLRDLTVSFAVSMSYCGGDQTIVAPTNSTRQMNTSANSGEEASFAVLPVGASSEVQYQLDNSDADVTVRLQTLGWNDSRGRLD